MKRVTIYTTDRCARCVNAKRLLAQRGIEWEELNLSKDADGRTALAAKTGLMTFPQIVVDDETIGGFDDLARAAADGRLQQLLAA